MSDELSGVDQGRIRFLKQRSTVFRNRILEQKAASLAAAATAQDEAEKSAARAERHRLADEQRANRTPGTVASGRQRFEQRNGNGTQNGDTQ